MIAAKALRFAEVRDVSLGEAHFLESDRLRIFWVLASVRDCQDLDYLTPADVSDILRDVQGIHLPRQRVSAILQQERGTVSRRRITGKNYYKIMKEGVDLVVPAIQTAIYVDPENALTHIRRFEDVLAGLNGDLRICDPYVENKTLDLLVECRSASSVSLLTANVLKESKLRRDLAAFEQEHSLDLEIRIVGQGLLHDRYIIHDGGMLMLGASLNGFAKKQSFIVPLGPDIKAATMLAFQRMWSSASKF